jgi:hypothetical protein
VDVCKDLLVERGEQGERRKCSEGDEKGRAKEREWMAIIKGKMSRQGRVNWSDEGAQVIGRRKGGRKDERGTPTMREGRG